MKKIEGNIHSFETLGTVDGPGIRFVVFMQGCPMHCKYCHNPDTWSLNNNKIISVSEILKKYDNVKEFMKNGGITVTGGEPLVQIDFVTELFKSAKEKNIHTTLDTSGILFNKESINKYNRLIKYTDLVLLDIKHINDDKHKDLTGYSNKQVIEFAKYLSKNNISIWIRHVLVPSITDNENDLKELGKFIASLKTVKALEILPYHDMAKEKYKKLGIDYPLKEIKPPDKNQILKSKELILNEYKKCLQENT